MAGSFGLEIDMIEELRLRRDARENYVPAERRSKDWHPVVLDEMKRRELELDERGTSHKGQ